MSITIDDQQSRISWPRHECAICGSKAIGVNFGAPTCAPCKAFFRRNARRKEILESPCQHHDIDSLTINNDDNYNQTNRYLPIRRCSSCRLRRCFDMGMKEIFIRTDEENIQHKELVDRNRRRRELLKQKQQEKLLVIPQSILQNNAFLSQSDWRHLSNIVSAYDTYCLKTYAQQRSTMFINETRSYSYETMPVKPHTALPMNLTASLFPFLRSLPAFHSLSQINRIYLTKNNLRPLLFLNMFELNQTCYSEPWQISLDNATWKFICGSELYDQFSSTENLAERSLIADPTITRLWIVILFFSSSLLFLYDSNIPLKIPKKRTSVRDLQNAYVTLLWNYLLYRYGNLGAIHIYSNLIYVFLKMQRVGIGIGIQIRTRNELMITHEKLNQLVAVDIRDN